MYYSNLNLLGHGVQEFGLVPLKVAIWGPFVLLNVEQSSPQQGANGKAIGNEWLGSSSEILSTNGVDSSLSYICRREYTIECNWKVSFFLEKISLLLIVFVDYPTLHSMKGDPFCCYVFGSHYLFAISGNNQ